MIPSSFPSFSPFLVLLVAVFFAGSYLFTFIMVSTTAALFVFSLMTLTLGRPSVMRSEMVVRDEHPSIPKGYSAGGDAPLPGATLRLTLAMPQTNISGLHSALMDVSDPSSENYGRHLSKAEVRAHRHRPVHQRWARVFPPSR